MSGAAIKSPGGQEATDLPHVPLAGGWETFLDGPARQALERSVLPGYLPRQRWFGGKARRLEAVRLVDRAALPGGPAHTFLTWIEIAFADGTRDLYFLPLGVTPGPAASRLPPAKVLARLTGPAGEALLHDALAGAEFCSALLSAIARGAEFTTRAGRVRAFATSAFAELRGRPDEPLPASPGPETSSNSLVYYGRRLLLKMFRRLEVGINPDIEIGLFLTERSNFSRIPRVAGTVEYHRGDEEPISLAILQAFVPNQADGWRHTLDELARYFERVSREQQPPTREAVGPYLHQAATLGRRTAEMHLALARGTSDPAFAPEPLGPADRHALTAEIQEEGRQALAALRSNLDRLPADIGGESHQFLEEGPELLERCGQAPAVSPGLAKIRCHGDYHLGQVLWADGDFVILDFEGEPTRTVAQRRARQSPLKDVAGMLRSFDYAAHAGLFAFTGGRPDDLDRLEPWARLWQQSASAAFLVAYRETAAGAPFLPADPAEFTALLDAFTLAKAFYELVYELNNRPDWVRIPLRGILALLAGPTLAKGMLT